MLFFESEIRQSPATFSAQRSCRYAVVAALLVSMFLVQACASNDPYYRYAGPAQHLPVVVIGGAVQQTSGQGSVSPGLWTYAVENALRQQSLYDFVSYPVARQSLGRYHAELLRDYAEDGFLSSSSVELLGRLALPARYLLLLSSDGPRDLPKRIVRHSAQNAHGQTVSDRTSLTYYRARDNAITGSVFDMASGQRVWHRSFETRPVTSRTYTQYHGSSFAGSVAAIVANRFINGRESGRFPPPPPAGQTIGELANELVYQLFKGTGHI